MSRRSKLQSNTGQTNKTNEKIKTTLNNKQIAETLFNKINTKCKNHTQKELIRAIDKNEITLVIGPAGVGKAQPLDCSVITPYGQKIFRDIEIGDEIMNVDGTISKVIEIHEQGKINIYEVEFSDGTKTECSGEHLWFTKTDNDRNHKNRIKGSSKKYIKTEKQGSLKNTLEIMNTLLSNRGVKNHSIPITKPVNFLKQKLIIDPYIIGTLIGDGSLTQNRISFCTSDEESIKHLKKVLNKNVNIKKSLHKKYEYSITGKHNKNIYLNELRKIKLIPTKSNNKFIPQKYLINTVENRIKLLQGLMDTDGYVSKNGVRLSFSTVSEQLKNDFRFLIESLGGIVSIKTKIPYYKNKHNEKIKCQLSYIFSIKLPSNILPFKLSRKKNLVIPKTKYKATRYIVNIKYIGKKEAKCISVDNSKLYLTNNFIVTHNSHISIAKALELLTDPDNFYKKIYIITPNVEADESSIGYLKGTLEEKLFPFLYSTYYLMDKIIGKENRKKLQELQIIEPLSFGHIRGINIDDAILICEEAQNTSISQMKTLLTRIGFNSKFIISGDVEQIDTKIKKSGLLDAVDKFEDFEPVSIIKFTSDDIVRNPLIGKILEFYNKTNEQ